MQEALDADLKAMQYYNSRNFDHAGNSRMLFVLREVKGNLFDFWRDAIVEYSYFKTILPVVSVINRWYKKLHFRCAGIPVVWNKGIWCNLLFVTF